MEIEIRIKNVLNKIRPFLKSGGGDVEFIKYEAGIVYVRLIGACHQCPLAEATLKTTIEGTLKAEIEEVTKVIKVD